MAIAGSTWTWTVSSAAYPISEGWVLSYRMAGSAVLAWSTSWISNDGTTHTVAIPYTTTAGLTPGRYEFSRVWVGAGTYSGQRFLEALDPLTVQADPTSAAPGERVAFAEAALAAVEAALTARFAGDEPEEYTIGNRSVRKMSLVDLQRTRAQLQTELWRLKNPGVGYRSLAVRFTQPSA